VNNESLRAFLSANGVPATMVHEATLPFVAKIVADRNPAAAGRDEVLAHWSLYDETCVKNMHPGAVESAWQMAERAIPSQEMVEASRAIAMFSMHSHTSRFKSVLLLGEPEGSAYPMIGACGDKRKLIEFLDNARRYLTHLVEQESQPAPKADP
jgi:hypothetical protein